MKDKDKKKQLKLSENLVEGEEEIVKEAKPKKEKEKPANKMWIVAILVATVLASLFFKYLAAKNSQTDGVDRPAEQNQSGGYAF